MIQPIVEGHGDAAAAGKLIARRLSFRGCYGFSILSPMRAKRSDFLTSSRLEKYLKLARSKGADRILALYDADDDCAVECAKITLSLMRQECEDLLCEAVAPVKEFEAWLLAGSSGLCAELDRPSYPGDPEARRDAKGQLAKLLGGSECYSPSVDQARLTALFDMNEAWDRSRSFRAFCTAVDRLAGISPC